MWELNLCQNKVVLVDWGLFLHRAVFAWGSGDGKIPATYTCLNMLISSLKLVGVEPDDTVIIAVDGRGNWRRDVDPQYKANRKDLRKESHIDWNFWYDKFDELLEKLKVSTPFHYIRIPKLEADDIIAVSCKYFKDKECIVISTDSDFEQLCAFKNVKLFSPVSRKYKIIQNPYKVLADKIKKEKTDNLTSDVITEEDFKRRKMVVGLLNLPDFVSVQVLDKIKGLEYNEFDLRLMPFNSLRERFMEIYNSDKIVTFEKCVLKLRKKKQKRKNKNVRNTKSSTKIIEG